MKNVKKIVLYVAIAAVVIGCGIVVRSKTLSSTKSKPAQVTASKTSVEVETVATTEKTSGDTYKATLEAYQQGIITSKISAKVLTVSVENGQYVNVGDVIATLDDQDIQNTIKSAQAQLQVNEQQLNSAQASLEKNKVNLDDAQRNYDRQKALFEGKVISQADLDAAEKTLNSAKADYDSQVAAIAQSQASVESQKVTIANDQDNLKNTIIKAPISGVISEKNISIGQMASPGSTLAKINNISSVYATIQVPQDKITGVKVGQAATVTVDGSDKTYSGSMQNMDLSADSTSRDFNCKVKIDNSDKSLLPGIYAKVELASAENTEIITVPVNALVGNEGDYYVFINNNGTAKKQKVTIGETNGNNVEVTSGVQAGDEVICTNTSTIQDGDAIDVVKKQDSGTEDAASKQEE